MHDSIDQSIEAYLGNSFQILVYNHNYWGTLGKKQRIIPQLPPAQVVLGVYLLY